MLKKNILLLLLFVFALTITSCDSDNNKANQVTDDTAKVTEDRDYDIKQGSYIDKQIKITYPQITGLADANKQEKINELIKKEAIEVLGYYKDVEGEVSLDIKYDIKLKGANLLSIQYAGLGNIEGAAYPNNVFYTTNIDMNNDKKVKLTDCISINEAFEKKVKEGKYVPWNDELNSVIEIIKENINSYDLINEFNNADSISKENIYNLFSYFTKDSLGISIGIPHVLGDHAEFEIKYEDIKDEKAENEIWKEYMP